MAIVVRAYLDDDYEELIKQILATDKRISSQSSLIGYCLDEIAKRDYYEVYERVIKNKRR